MQQPPAPTFDDANQGTSTLAIVSLCLAIFGFVTICAGIGVAICLLALILGVVAMNNISASGNRLGGHGLALAGTIIGGVGTASALLIIPLMIGIMLPALGAARRTARQMQSNTQVRGIHQAMVMYAQSNNSMFPGLTPDGNVLVDANTPYPGGVNGGHPAERLELLLDGNYFTGEYAISPVETGLTEWQGGQVNEDNYSYAMLRVAAGNTGSQTWRKPPGQPQPNYRGQLVEPLSDTVEEWSETLNTEAPVLGDRNTGADATTQVSSIHTPLNSGDWRGSVAFNDNHVVFETYQTLSTRFGSGPYNDDFSGTGDNLFIDNDGAPLSGNGVANAAWVYSDAVTYVDQQPSLGTADSSPQ
ncbi:MAG: DUF4190 domain-containing protein [Planctomycetota bacterium]